MAAVFIGSSIALFVSGYGSDPSSKDTRPSKRSSDVSGKNDVLNLPKKQDEPTDSRKRGQVGRGDDFATPTTGADDKDDQTGPALPTTATNLRDVAVTVVPASAGAAADVDASRTLFIAGIRTRCAPQADTERLPSELALAARLDALLQRASANPARLDGAQRTLPCVDKRLALQERSRFVLVLQAAPSGPSRVLLPRQLKGASARDIQHAQVLGGEIATALGLAGAERATSKSDLQLLTDTGAVDRPGGGTVVFVRVALPDTSNDALDAIALDLLRSLAATATSTRTSDS